MEITEVQKKLSELKTFIFNTINTFEKETQTYIVSVDLFRVPSMGNPDGSLADVNIEVRI